MDPLLVDVPERLLTPRLVLRCPAPVDGPIVNAAICETLDALRPWMPWAQVAPTMQESEGHVRRAQAQFRLRQDLPLLIFERLTDDSEGMLVGSTGLHRMKWEVPSFEIGYWRRTGCGAPGIITEAVQALTRMCFDTLAAQRVEIRMDDANLRSRRVAERAGFQFEAVLRLDSIGTDGTPRSTRVYARVRGVEAPQSSSASTGA